MKAEAQGARKFRDNLDTTGTRPKIPGRLATMLRLVTAASAAAQKLIGYSALKAKQMDVVMGIVSERDVFTTVITR